MFGKNEPRDRIETNGADHNGARESTAGAAPGRVQHSILSADTRLTGDLVSGGDITVEGTIDGSIKCRTLTLSGQPKIKGTVEAEAAHVSGTFNGELRATKVILTKTAKMTGDIYQEIIEMHAGAQFEGKVASLSPSQSSPAAKAKKANGRNHGDAAEGASEAIT